MSSEQETREVNFAKLPHNRIDEMEFLSPHHLLHLVRIHWTWFLIFVLLGGAIGSLWNDVLVTPSFKSTATVFAGFEYGNEGGASDSSNSDGSDKERDEDAKMRSAFAKANLEYRYLATASLLIGDYQRLMTSRMVQNDVKERVNQKLAEENMPERGFKVTAEYDRNSRMISITGSSPSPREAQLSAQETAKVFIKTVGSILRLNNIQEIDEADYPDKADTRSRSVKTAIGLAIGFFIAMLLFVVLDYFDQTVKTPEDVINKLKIPAIGTIPMSEEAMRSSKLDTRSNLGLVGFTEKGIAEAFRMVRTNLQYLVLPQSGNARVFMLTSALAGEGKSSCAVNLAMITAQSRKKVLLIDADLRKPSVNKVLNVEKETGLVDIICHTATKEDVVEKNVRRLSLDVILSGASPANPSELLMSKNFSDLINDFRKEYDYIFIDAPPCMMMADPLVIGQLCDGTIFVVSSGSTKIDAIKMSLSQLEQTNVKVCGILLNKFTWEHAGYGYYNYYNYYYYYNNYNNANPQVDYVPADDIVGGSDKNG